MMYFVLVVTNPMHQRCDAAMRSSRPHSGDGVSSAHNLFREKPFSNLEFVGVKNTSEPLHYYRQ
jgi:hypothetical protein